MYHRHNYKPTVQMVSFCLSFNTASVTSVVLLFELKGKRIPPALLHSPPGHTLPRHAGSEEQHCRNQ